MYYLDLLIDCWQLYTFVIFTQCFTFATDTGSLFQCIIWVHLITKWVWYWSISPLLSSLETTSTFWQDTADWPVSSLLISWLLCLGLVNVYSLCVWPVCWASGQMLEVKGCSKQTEGLSKTNIGLRWGSQSMCIQNKIRAPPRPHPTPPLPPACQQFVQTVQTAWQSHFVFGNLSLTPHCIFLSPSFSLSPPNVGLSCALHHRKPPGPHHGFQEVIEDETTRAAQCESGTDRPGSSCHHVPSGCGLGLEPPLARGRCYLSLLWSGRILLWHCQHHESDCFGHSALHSFPQSAVSQWVILWSKCRWKYCLVFSDVFIIRFHANL